MITPITLIICGALDITKTNAIIPYQFKKEISRLIENTRLESISKINRHVASIKNKISYVQDNSLIWNEKENKELRCYRYYPNIDHPIFQNIITSNKVDRKTLKFIFDLIADNLPVARIIENNDNDSGKHDRMLKIESLSEEELILAKDIYEKIKINKNKAEALDFMSKCEPFCYHQEQIKKYINE